jgi:FkbM family methyltransferase
MFRNPLQRAKQIGVCLMLTSGPLRRILNRHHLNLDDDGRKRFHGLYSKMFTRRSFHRLMRGLSGGWTVRFMNRDIVMPLNGASLWLDWDSALAIIGHDNEVKQTYAALLSSETPPELFFDVGANYGSHSILFCSAAIPVIAVEPNPTCFDYCKLVCELNGFSLPQWERVAVGDRRGQVDLVYPAHETWLGSISPAVAQAIGEDREMTRHVVPLRPLDDYLDHVIGKRLLIKIDVEGFEQEVLHGASRILADVRPRVIFESNERASRLPLHDLFGNCDYGVHTLPWRGADRQSSPMTAETFRQSEATNFMAAPLTSP